MIEPAWSRAVSLGRIARDTVPRGAVEARRFCRLRDERDIVSGNLSISHAEVSAYRIVRFSSARHGISDIVRLCPCTHLYVLTRFASWVVHHPILPPCQTVTICISDESDIQGESQSGAMEVSWGMLHLQDLYACPGGSMFRSSRPVSRRGVLHVQHTPHLGRCDSAPVTSASLHHAPSVY
mgnify:FL=1